MCLFSCQNVCIEICVKCQQEIVTIETAAKLIKFFKNIQIN